eukprot:TRINITY_DN5130_c0_g1_i3.p1 TRINITY_DN5130_c0_g1~~TRINITY_DN5130_c0_g1_i3.p1  ORF type:complete len:194 (-),score=37.50 TRINITY_DN5130_c0_g1_i3:171-752(-)
MCIRDSYPRDGHMPREVQITASLHSKTTGEAVYSEKFKVEFVWGFQIREGENSVHLSRSHPATTVHINSNHELDVRSEDDALRRYIRTQYSDSKHVMTINITIPEYSELADTILQTRIFVYSRITNQTDTISFSYSPTAQWNPMASIPNISITNVFMIIALLFIVGLLVYSFLFSSATVSNPSSPPRSEPFVR